MKFLQATSGEYRLLFDVNYVDEVVDYNQDITSRKSEASGKGLQSKRLWKGEMVDYVSLPQLFSEKRSREEVNICIIASAPGENENDHVMYGVTAVTDIREVDELELMPLNANDRRLARAFGQAVYDELECSWSFVVKLPLTPAILSSI